MNSNVALWTIIEKLQDCESETELYSAMRDMLGQVRV